jgi:hypothetical protein
LYKQASAIASIIKDKKKMVKPVQSPSPRTDYFIIFIKVVFVLVIILLLPRLVNARDTLAHKRRRQFVTRFSTQVKSCTFDGECKQIPLIDRLLCISKCVDPTCHEQIYGADPLEPGEVDEARELAFEICVREKNSAHRR